MLKVVSDDAGIRITRDLVLAKMELFDSDSTSAISLKRATRSSKRTAFTSSWKIR
jgi:hypothetical protein